MTYSKATERSYRRQLNNILRTIKKAKEIDDYNTILQHLRWNVSEIIKDIHKDQEKEEYKSLLYYALGVQNALNILLS